MLCSRPFFMFYVDKAIKYSKSRTVLKTDSHKIIPPDALIKGYQNGIFPMSASRHDESYEWYGARRRGIIPINDFKVSKNVRRLIRQGRYSWKVNSCFRAVITECANRKTTWISDLIIRSYDYLNRLGYAHSVEIFDQDGNLTGGLYGVSVGSAFFGESMFNREPEADKIALHHCHRVLDLNGYELWDTQYYTDHLAQFGCKEIPNILYLELLEKALQKETLFDSSVIKTD